jgi:hypothetical protein
LSGIFSGCDLVNLNNNYPDAVVHFEKASGSTQLSPWLTGCCMRVMSTLINLKKALAALQTAIQHIYRVPELTRFAIKQEYYLVTENPEKRFAVMEMWVKLYPRDVRGHFSWPPNTLNATNRKKSLPNIVQSWNWIRVAGTIYNTSATSI